MSSETPRDFSASDAARLVGVSVSTLRRLLREGWAPACCDERGRVRLGFADIARLRRVVALSAKERRARRRGQLPLDLAAGRASVAQRNVDATRRWYRSARLCETSDRDQAIELYQRILELCPRHARAHVNLGRLLHTRGELEAAVEHYEAAVASEPCLSTAWFNLGVALEDLGRPRQAVRVYQQHVLRIDPNDGDAHFNAARLCERLGDQLGAVRHLRRYRRLSEV